MEKSHFARGDHTLKVPMSLFAENRARLLTKLLANPAAKRTGGFVLLRGGVDVPFNDTDVNLPFRQVRLPPVWTPALPTWLRGKKSRLSPGVWGPVLLFLGRFHFRGRGVGNCANGRRLGLSSGFWSADQIRLIERL